MWGNDGMDELSLGAASLVGELRDGQVREYEVHPEDFGFPMASNRSLKVEGPEQSRQMLIGVLDGHLFGAPVDIFNQGARTFVVALGMTLVIATRGIDVSVGAVVAIAGTVAADRNGDGYVDGYYTADGIYHAVQGPPCPPPPPPPPPRAGERG